jgi:hypothetical protein
MGQRGYRPANENRAVKRSLSPTSRALGFGLFLFADEDGNAGVPTRVLCGQQLGEPGSLAVDGIGWHPDLCQVLTETPLYDGQATL